MARALEKVSSGVAGLDELTHGGLPRGRPTLVCGGPGCGKTMLGLQFLVRGALDHGEPGVFLAFEETAEDLAVNVASVGWDLDALAAEGQLITDHVRIDPQHIQEAGAYDLEGLFVRLGADIAEIGARRVVIDTLEVLFASLRDQALLRAELRRLFAWLKEHGVTAMITAERGEGSLTRHGLEEYVSDCVLLLDHRVAHQVTTRRLRVVKYRGSAHATDETPFMIDEQGFRVMPLSSLRLEHEATAGVVSSGVPDLDAMFGIGGCYRGSSILITGTPGSAKTTIAGSFARTAAAGGQRALYMSLEESPAQLQRNLASVGVHFPEQVASGRLRLVSTRPSAYGLEEHLALLLHEVNDFEPDLVVLDPLSGYGLDGADRQAMLTRMIDLLKARSITGVFTGLLSSARDETDLGISSVIDTWLTLGNIERNGERTRTLAIVKARGMSHSNQVREFVLTDEGIELLDVYRRGGDVYTGAARRQRMEEDRA